VKASVGDRIEVQGVHVGEGRRQGEVVEARGAEGGPRTWCAGRTGTKGSSFPGLTRP
jgi:hypothetical protein